MDGKELGTVVGKVLGTIDGVIEEGAKLGKLDGSSEGIIVGIELGIMVGDSLGSVVGTTDGSMVGRLDDDNDGLKLGIVVVGMIVDGQAGHKLPSGHVTHPEQVTMVPLNKGQFKFDEVTLNFNS